MKISSFICLTNAVKRGDTFIEAIKTHLYFSDELVIVDGGSTDGTIEAIQELNDSRIRIETLIWEEDWCWSEFARHWNFGYQKCTGDWVAAGESDHIFHEDITKSLLTHLQKHTDSDRAAADLDKIQISLIENGSAHAFSKSRFPYFLNKKCYGNKLGYGLDRNNHTDLCFPIFIEKKIDDLFYEGTTIKDNQTARIPLVFLNYAWTFKTWDMILEERRKACRGWNKYPDFIQKFPKTEKGIEDMLKNGIISKYIKRNRILPLEAQPLVMQQRLSELKSGMMGFDLCGLLELACTIESQTPEVIPIPVVAPEIIVPKVVAKDELTFKNAKNIVRRK